MKNALTISLLLLMLFSYDKTVGQDFDNLVKLGELYSRNVNATGEEFKSSVEKLRTPGLNHIVDALIAVGQGDKKLLSKEFLSKPSEQELKYWYVIREIHYNRQSKDKKPRPDDSVARNVLAQTIDERWLVDNYYYRIRGGVAKMFNTEDLSTYNIDLNEYGLKNDTEKAIVFFALSESMITRFRVLKMLKNNDKLIEFAKKLPAFNGKPYYEYKAFGFEDFNWIGFDKLESYKGRNLGNLYAALGAHFSALGEKGIGNEQREIYLNSILSTSEYFKYSGAMENDLKELHKKSKD